MTSVAVNTYTHSVTYVADNILKSFKDIVRLSGLDPGKLVADWTDPQPETCVEGPIGLQLHSNKVAQEVHWKGLIISENPEDVLISVEE